MNPFQAQKIHITNSFSRKKKIRWPNFADSTGTTTIQASGVWEVPPLPPKNCSFVVDHNFSYHLLLAVSSHMFMLPVIILVSRDYLLVSSGGDLCSKHIFGVTAILPISPTNGNLISKRRWYSGSFSFQKSVFI